MATTSKGVRRDAFIKSVRPDPKSTEELVLLQGYIGDSDLAGHVRVYSDAALSDFIEVPEQDVLYSDPVNTEEDSLGGSRLWVKKTTVFTAGDPRHANRVKSSFLEGDIVKAFGDTGKIPNAVAHFTPNFTVITRVTCIACITLGLEKPSCNLSCLHYICPCFQASVCFVDTKHRPAGWMTVVANQAIEQQFNPAAQQFGTAATGYTGGFNPYMTGY